ncbi:MAG: dihydrolipoyl dehydrogenase [Pseudomonadota bacterium]|nr:dihydrolipoyl dehydrogenase [Pseudomonadota bacterium]
MNDVSYDLVVIGGGPGGYVCAIRAAQLGLNVACIESRGALGGTCLNVGCIPSKALLHSSHLFEDANKKFASHGINLGSVNLDLKKMMSRKDKVVSQNVQGIEFLFKKNKVQYIKGRASFGSLPNGQFEINISDTKGKKANTISSKYVVIATGSESSSLKGVEIDEERIVTSTGALSLKKVPKTMTIIGGGVIGLEMGSVWRRLGAEVTVIEYLDHILPPLDSEIRQNMQKILTKQGISFQLGTKVNQVSLEKEKVRIDTESTHDGSLQSSLADVVMLSIGRSPVTSGLGLEDIGVSLAKNGFINVDNSYQTSKPGIYAIGDVIGGMMLAHKAEDEGVCVAEIISGRKSHVNYKAIASVVYTDPEVASIGMTEEEVIKNNIDYNIGKFPFSANSRARANGTSDGFVKLIADKTTDTLLGCHIIGPAAGDLIMEIAVGIEFSTSTEDIARTSHAHPQLGEAIKEAALAIEGRAIHI